MKFCVAPYELKPRDSSQTLSSVAASGSRVGALLRFEFEAKGFGYADCHPWPELGDLPLSGQLQKLLRGEFTPLTQRSYEFAKLDAEARFQKVSLWQRRTIPDSHVLVPDLLAVQSNSLSDWVTQAERVRQLTPGAKVRIKYKVGRDPEREAELLNSFSDVFRKAAILFRLDFNNQLLGASEFEKFLNKLDLRSLDFIEDPFPYDGPSWALFQKKFGIRLALDRMPRGLEIFPGSFSVLILKPAIQNPEEILSLAREQGAQVIVTSYMDHPYGQLCAAWVASGIPELKTELCGLETHLVYEAVSVQKEWSSVFASKLMTPREGFGFGLDHFLEGQNWEAPHVG